MICATVITSLVGFDLCVRNAEPVLDAYDVADYERKPAAWHASGRSEVVLMGSSRAKYALVPREFESVTGCTAYNLGIAGSKVVEWLTLARTLFAERLPRLVVLGVNASEFRADYEPTPAARNLFGFDDLVESVQLDGPSINVAGHYFRRAIGPAWAAYDRRYELKMWAQEQLAAWLPKHAQHSRELRIRVTKSCPPHGYDHPWMHGRQLRDLGVRLLENRAGVVAASVPTFAADASAFRRFDQLLAWLQGRGVAVVVAYMPNSPETETRWAGVEPQMIQVIETVCQHRGVPFVGCNRSDVPRTNHDYLEEIHVGLPLASRISRRIARIVEESDLLGRGAALAQTPEDEMLP